MRRVVLASLLLAVALLWPGAAGPGPAAAGPLLFHCALDPSCPEVSVAGDPYATLGGGPAPFRGYGDPSLEYDPGSGTLWMAYSWLDVLVSSLGPPPVIDFGVRTHLARSGDGGASWTFVSEANGATPVVHPDSGTGGWASHEVSTLVREGPGVWQMLWLTYFDPFGSAPFYDPYYERATGTAPDALPPAEAWAQGNGTSASWGAQHNLSTLPQLSDCTAFTEPALFAYGGVTYLATNCVVIQGGVRQDAQERLVLLRQETAGYSYAGVLLDGGDAAAAGGSRIEQADITLSQTGEILLIATPIQNAEPNHLGCIVFEISDITSAQVLRDGGGQAVQLARITGDDPVVGPGLCTYDAASATGVVTVLHILTPSPFDLEFSMRATGLQPMDTDGDGVENTLDPDDDGDGYADASDACPTTATAWPTPPGDSDCDGFTSAAEGSITTDPADPCAQTATASDEADDRWPADFDDNQAVNVTDVLALKPWFNTTVPPTSARYDISPGGGVSISDVLALRPFFGKGCT